MSQAQWQQEMIGAASNFSNILWQVTENSPIPDDYHYFGGPIVPRLYDVFDKFCSGDLDSLDNTIQDLNDLNMRLGRDHAKLIGDAIDHLDDWEGSAAENARSYLRGMEAAINRKRECVDALILVVKAQRAVVEGLRSDVLQLIDKTNTGIEQAGANKTKLVLAVVGAIAAVASAAIPGGPIAAAVVGAMMSGAVSVYSASLDGHNRAQVIVSMVVAGEEIVARAEEARAQIEKGFAEVAKYLTGNELKYVRPDRPRVVSDGGFEPDDFHPEDGYTPQVRDRLPKDDVVVEPPKQPDRPSDHGPWGTEDDAYPEQIRS
ncbi:hypothetical protein JOF41_001520 [Saccharothrix coeruleofusca]|uniref:hypothetical protein n=1 Tax=Saccharothrix coeruleofusca TaxID=33919 RepID=UPI001AE89D4B|nr:hypothetical protein [Saccharothrix coeruleofusca]MBP2335342.1 hypothetical protein [Saccharothrix coeruleofusca]